MTFWEEGNFPILNIVMLFLSKIFLMQSSRVKGDVSFTIFFRKMNPVHLSFRSSSPPGQRSSSPSAPRRSASPSAPRRSSSPSAHGRSASPSYTRRSASPTHFPNSSSPSPIPLRRNSSFSNCSPLAWPLPPSPESYASVFLPDSPYSHPSLSTPSLPARSFTMSESMLRRASLLPTPPDSEERMKKGQRSHSYKVFNFPIPPPTLSPGKMLLSKELNTRLKLIKTLKHYLYIYIRIIYIYIYLGLEESTV